MNKNNSNNVAIKVNNISKSFKIPLDGGSSLKQKIIHFLKRQKGYRLFSPLNNVSFTINKGEFFGIVGRNGSGKSTLLKTMAGIYTPDKGGVYVDGVLVPFIELGVGFNPELTGRENVFLNGALLGFSRQEILGMYDDVVDFAELHEFMEEKLKNYSSGMQVRLAFSIAIRAKGDILLLDEVLAVGDSAFQQKCYAYFNKLKDSGQTVVLVTHSMAAVERFCTRALLLEDGSIVKVGSSNDIAALYEDLFIDKPNKSKTVEDKSQDNSAPVVLSTKIERNGTATSDVRFGDNFSVVVDIDTKTNIKSGNVGINIRNEKGDVVFSSDTRPHIGDFNLSPGQTKQIRYNIEDRYTNGDYAVDVHLVDELSDSGVLARRRESAKFTSHGVTTHSHSLFHPEYSVEDI